MNLPDNERFLFRLVAEGNEQAFTSLFNLFLPRLYPFIIKLTRSEGEAQEIIQETFIKLWLNRDKLADMENPGGWLFRVASNRSYDYLRAQALNNKFFRPIAAEHDTPHAPDGGLDAKELQRLIGEAIQTLPAQRKKIYLMSREQGKTIPEIAAVLNISPHTVKNTLVTSLKHIREYLARHGVIYLIFSLFIF